MRGFRFKSAQPTAQPSSGYASRISRTSWSQYEDIIRQLHSGGNTRDEILRILVNDHHFEPSIGQLRDQMARWGLRTYRTRGTRASSDSDNISFSNTSASNSTESLLAKPQSWSVNHAYASVPDNFFNDVWSQEYTGLLQYQAALEAEFLADMLFLGRRYVAAFNLYSAIYHATPFSCGFDDTELAVLRFRTCLSCLRTYGNNEQRQKITSITQQVLKSGSPSTYCKPVDINLPPQAANVRSSAMTDLHTRESFRFLLASASSSHPMSMATRLRIASGGVEALGWCLNRLKACEFVSVYNEQLRRPGSGPAGLSCDGCQTIIYWYLVVDGLSQVNPSPPCFTIRHLSGRLYTLTLCETFALVAAMLNAHAWISFTDDDWLERLQEWGEGLMRDDVLFHDVLERVIHSSLAPTYSMRKSKSMLDMSAAVDGFPAYRIPTLDTLRGLATQMISKRPTNLQAETCSEALDTNSFYSNAFIVSTLGNLTWEYSDIIRSYINNGSEHGTDHDFEDKPRTKSQPDFQNLSTRPKSYRISSSSGKHQLTGTGDPVLSSSIKGSKHGSFRSFKSIHLRTKITDSKRSDQDLMEIDAALSESGFERMSLDSIGSSDLFKKLSVGVR